MSRWKAPASRCSSGDLRGIVRARRLSRATMRNIRQNLFFAFIYNAAGVPIAAGVLYPVFGILLSPMIGALAMSLSSVSVHRQRAAAAVCEAGMTWRVLPKPTTARRCS